MYRVYIGNILLNNLILLLYEMSFRCFFRKCSVQIFNTEEVFRKYSIGYVKSFRYNLKYEHRISTYSSRTHAWIPLLGGRLFFRVVMSWCLSCCSSFVVVIDYCMYTVSTNERWKVLVKHKKTYYLRTSPQPNPPTTPDFEMRNYDKWDVQ